MQGHGRFAADNADGERDSGDGHANRGHFLQREPLLSASDHVEQNPNRRGVLQDDGDGDARSLNRDVVEIIRGGDSQHAQDQALDEIGFRELDALPTTASDQQGEQDE